MDKIDIGVWVENDPDNIAFRQAAHTVLHAISITEALQSSMIMKGGVLLALGTVVSVIQETLIFLHLPNYPTSTRNGLKKNWTRDFSMQLRT